MARITKKQQKIDEVNLASHWHHKFKEAMVAKAPYTRAWKEYYEAYQGDYFKQKGLPDYKSDLVSNYIFSIIETIRPIMVDNDPKFQVMPRHPEGMKFSTDLQELLTYEWDREGMSPKLYQSLIHTLVYGTSVFFLPYSKKKKNICSIPVNPFNIYPDPLATSVEDAEYIIYARYENMYRLKKMFPDRAKELQGGDVKYGELVNENNADSKADDQVLMLEVWTHDYDSYEEDGTDKGRVLLILPDLGIVLSDKENPYQDKEFPFILQKDYDLPGKFWGEGEVAQLLSPQKHMNELNNAILDNAKATANMPWIVDKSAGIPKNSITNQPGLIIRKNQGSEVRREQPPGMPGYVVNAVETYKNDMEQVSGIFDTLKGNSETGVYTAQGILALQEAGQARIRLKVKLMEESLGRLARLWYSRIVQFWNEERYVRTVRLDGTYDFKMLKKDYKNYEYDIRILAGSTMPVNRGAMLDLMIRLAQTQMPDGSTLVDREAVAQYLPSEVKAALLQRMEEGTNALEQQIQQLGQGMEQLSQGLQQIGQQLEQVAQEGDSADEEQFTAIEEILGAIEHINEQLGTTQQEMQAKQQEAEQAEHERKLRDEGYNAGFTDAEGLATPDAMQSEESFTDDLGEDPDMGIDLPADIMNGLEQLTDDELALLIQSNPEIADLLG